MGSVQTNPSLPPTEPQLNLLLAQQESLWKSLSAKLTIFFFPKKLPPLKTGIKPEPVKTSGVSTITRRTAPLSQTAVHVVIIAIIIGAAIIARRVWCRLAAQTKVDSAGRPQRSSMLKPSKTQVGGGGGGGDRDVLQATRASCHAWR